MNLRFSRRHWMLGLGIVLILLGSSLYVSALTDPIAKGLWERFRMGGTALALNKKDSALAFDIGTRNFGVDSYNIPLARRAFEKAISIDPGMLWGHYQLARVLFVEGKFEEALKEIEKELHYNPGNLRALYVRGLIYAYNKNLPGAEVDFKRFVEWVPTEWAGYNDLAWVLAQEGKYIEAKATLDQAFAKVRDADTNPWLWNNLGVQQLNLREYASATHSFERAKLFASTLTEKVWRTAYPGNDPVTNTGGIQAFQEAIETNLVRARDSI